MKLVTLENDSDNSWSMNNTLRHAGYHCRGYYSIDALLESPWAAESDLAIIDSDGLDKGCSRILRKRSRRTGRCFSLAMTSAGQAN
jgi:DNA-binding NtrC family response regulator